MMNFRPLLWVPCLLMTALSSAQIVTLSARINVDNQFDAFLSTSATSLGSDPAFLSGNNWPVTGIGSIAINVGGTYFLHVRAVDGGPPAMFIGEFGLSNNLGTFASTGNQSLLSLTSTFTASTGANPGAVSQPVVDLGANGTSPWGNLGNVNSNAHFLWAGNPLVGAGVPVYFTTQINVVPEPAAFIGLSLGAAALLLKRRRR
jgi:hypothetical protein